MAETGSDIVGASAAGGGVGTLLMAFANQLPVENEWKDIVLLATPLLTVCVTGIWLHAKNVYINPYVAKKRQESTRRHLKNLIAAAKKHETEVLNDPQASEDLKVEIRKGVEQIERKLMRAIIDGVELPSD